MTTAAAAVARPKIVELECDRDLDTDAPIFPIIPSSLVKGDFIVFTYGYRKIVTRRPMPFPHPSGESWEAAILIYGHPPVCKIELSDTVLLPDALAYYKDVFTAKCAATIVFRVQLRPCDPSVLQLDCGVPDVHWHYVECEFQGSMFKGTKENWTVRVAPFDISWFPSSELPWRSRGYDGVYTKQGMHKYDWFDVVKRQEKRAEIPRISIYFHFKKLVEISDISPLLLYGWMVKGHDPDFPEPQSAYSMILYGPADVEDTAARVVAAISEHFKPLLVKVSKPDYQWKTISNLSYIPTSIIVPFNETVVFRPTYLLNKVVLRLTPVLLALGLYNYEVLFILDWLPAVWRIGQYKKMAVIEGVAKSIQKLIERREEAKSNKRLALKV